MISNIQNIKKARELRLSGRSLSEISKELDISKSTLSNWLKDITLSVKQVSEMNSRVDSKVKRGRLNALISKKSSRIFNEKKIYDEAVKDFPTLMKDSFFILGLSMYWAKGTVKGNSFQFTSSDQMKIKIMNKWIGRYLAIDSGLIKNMKYDSCVRISVTRIDVLRRVIAWQKLLLQYYGNVL